MNTLVQNFYYKFKLSETYRAITAFSEHSE